ACQMGQSGMALTDAGGWAQQFIRAGASAFIGAYWSVQDASAKEFAESLYNHLLSGKTLGQAALSARQAVFARNPLTALAYTIFGHPNAICAG
uniref:CHAT domain-containing protein n=1 Tax=Anaerolinea sp. TaxID=1872519 RepID=UPI002ACEE911